MNQEQIKNIIEAALMVSDKPLNMQRILSLFGRDEENIDREMVRAAVEQLQQDYSGRGMELCEVASGYRVQVRSEYADWINRLYDEKPPRYSRALLETLAIIAYRQPLTRAEIEDIRGVSVSTTIIKTLQEREWIRVVGHKDVPGRPELLASTKEFLDYFNLKKLSDLPTLAEIKELNQANPDLFSQLENSQPSTDEADHEPAGGMEMDLQEESADADETPGEAISDENEANTDDSDDTYADEDHKVIPFTG